MEEPPKNDANSGEPESSLRKGGQNWRGADRAKRKEMFSSPILIVAI